MKFIKRKIAVCLLVLFACTGMAMAQNYTSSYKTCPNGHAFTGNQCGICASCKSEYPKIGGTEAWQKQCLPDKN